MKTLGYRIELLSDVIATERSATEKGHRSLDHLPGAMILGAAAARLYRTLLDEDPLLAFKVFHSGKVRFLPAWPEGPGETVGIPMPLSLHREKGAETHHNLAAGDRARLRQPKQIRQGFMTAHGVPGEPRAKRVRLKSSRLHRDEAKEGGKTSALFAYEALPAGLMLRGALHLDDDLPDGLGERIIGALSRDVIGLGRSRSAEYGRARLDPVDAMPPMSEGTPSAPLLLLCLTDLAPLAPTGQPTLRPDPSWFGLPDTVTVDPDRCFIRTRRYSPFNGKRQRPDLERQVIIAGSVIALKGVSEESLAALRTHLESGVGAYRQDGLGQIALHPELLLEEHPVQQRAAEQPGGSASAPPDDALAAWLGEKEEDRCRTEAAYELACQWANALLPFGRRRGGPGRAQWGLVRSHAAIASDGASLRRLLFGAPEDATDPGLLGRGVRAKPWKELWGGTSAYETMVRNTGSCPDDLLPRALEITAMRIGRLLQDSKEVRS